jgi:hypothetical protein
MADHISPRLARWRPVTDAPLLIVTIGSLPLLLLELDRNDTTHSDRIFLDIVNVVVLVAFASGYVVELALASNRGSYVRHEGSSLVIVVAPALALLPSLAAFGALRVRRAGRAWRGIAVVERTVIVGRRVATMVVGISRFAVVTAKVAEFLVRSARAEDASP